MRIGGMSRPAHVLALMLCVLPSMSYSSSSGQNPVVLLGGRDDNDDNKGFLMSTNGSNSHEHLIQGVVQSVTCSVDGVVVATEGELGIVDVSSGVLVPRVTALSHPRVVLSYPFMSQTRYVVGGFFEGGVAFWDGDKLEPLPVPPLAPPCVMAMAWLHGESRAAADQDFFVGGCFTGAGTAVSDGTGGRQTDSGAIFVEGDRLASVARYVALLRDERGEVVGGPHWQSLGEGLSAEMNDGVMALPQCFAMASVFGILYVGGYFTKAGKVQTRSVARWDTSSRGWQALGAGVDGVVQALAPAPSGGVFVGGHYCTVEDALVCNLAQWGPLTGWVHMGGGAVRGEVLSLLLMGPELWVGGKFVERSSGAFNVVVWSDNRFSRKNLPRSVGRIKSLAGCPCDDGEVVSAFTGVCVEPGEHEVHVDDVLVTLLFMVSVGIAAAGIVFMTKSSRQRSINQALNDTSSAVWTQLSSFKSGFGTSRRDEYDPAPGYDSTDGVPLVTYHLVNYDEL